MDTTKQDGPDRATEGTKPAGTDVAPPEDRVDDETEAGEGEAKTTHRQE